MNSSEHARRLRRLEFEAYASVISVFRAHGELTELKQHILNDLKRVLNVPNERHVAEVKRVLNDELLAAIACDVYKADLVGDKWLAEVRKPFANNAQRARVHTNTSHGSQKAGLTEPDGARTLGETRTKHEEEAKATDAEGHKQSVSVQSVQKCDAETQTDFEKHLEKQVAAIVAQIVDGRRELAPAATVTTQDKLTVTRSERKTSHKMKTESRSVQETPHAPKSAGKQLNTSKRRAKMVRKSDIASRKRVEVNGNAVSNGRKRARRVSKAANSDEQTGRAAQVLPSARTIIEATTPVQPQPTSPTRFSQQTRLQVLDSSQAPRTTSPISAEQVEQDVMVAQHVEVSDTTYVTTPLEEHIIEDGDGQPTDGAQSDSEAGSLNLNDTNFFIQHTMLTVDKHELVPSASGSHIFVDNASTTSSARPQSLSQTQSQPQKAPASANGRRARKTLADGQLARKGVKRLQQRSSTGDTNQHAVGRPAKRAKRDVALENNESTTKTGKPRKKRVSNDDPNASASSAFKVKLPAHRKTPTGPVNGTAGRSSVSATATNGRDFATNAFATLTAAHSNANSETAAAITTPRAPPTFAFATGTGFNYASLARHSTTPPNANARVGGAGAADSQSHSQKHTSPFTTAAQTAATPHSVMQNNPFLSVDSVVCSTPESDIAAMAITNIQNYEVVEEVASCNNSFRNCAPLQPVVQPALPASAASPSQLSQPVALAPALVPLTSSPQVRAAAAIAIRARSAIAASGTSATRPAAISRIVCVDRPQAPAPTLAPAPKSLVPLATRPTSNPPSAMGLADYQRNMMLAPRHISIAPPRSTQTAMRGPQPPTAVSVIVQAGMSAQSGVRPPIVTRRLPLQSIVSVIKPVLPNVNSQAK